MSFNTVKTFLSSWNRDIKPLLLSLTMLGLTVSNSGFAKTIRVDSDAKGDVAYANEQPIRFDKDTISTTFSGTLSPKQNEQWYHFDATSWQYVVINIAPLAGTPETANVGVLYTPKGKQEGTKGGIIYQGCLAETGTYRLRIARNLMATLGQTAGYRVEMVILPKYASESLCEYL